MRELDGKDQDTPAAPRARPRLARHEARAKLLALKGKLALTKAIQQALHDACVHLGDAERAPLDDNKLQQVAAALNAAWEQLAPRSDGLPGTRQLLLERLSSEFMLWIAYYHDPKLADLATFTYAISKTIVDNELKTIGSRALHLEREDAALRDAAMKNRDRLVDYLRWGRERLRRQQLARPGRWHLGGYDDEEFRDAAELQVLALFNHDTLKTAERAGQSAYLVVAGAWRDGQRRQRAWFDANASKGRLFDVIPYAPSPEDILAAAEGERHRDAALQDLPRHLGVKLTRWWNALLITGGERGMGTKAATSMNRNRSAATRAHQRIKARLRSALGPEVTALLGDDGAVDRAPAKTNRRKSPKGTAPSEMTPTPPTPPPPLSRLPPAFLNARRLIRKALRVCRRDPSATPALREALRACFPIDGPPAVARALKAIDALLNGPVWLGPAACAALLAAADELERLRQEHVSTT